VEVTLPGDETEYESEGSSDSNDSDQDSSAPSAPSFSPLTSDGEHSSEDDNINSEEELATVSLAEPPEPQPAPAKKTTKSYSFVGDNYDKTIKPRYMRVGEGNRSIHYFHYFCVPDRVDVSHLSIIPPQPPTITPKECALSLLPSIADDRVILQNTTTLVSRILATHLGTLGFDCAGASGVAHLP
jgi:hypothetical protein